MRVLSWSQDDPSLSISRFDHTFWLWKILCLRLPRNKHGVCSVIRDPEKERMTYEKQEFNKCLLTWGCRRLRSDRQVRLGSLTASQLHYQAANFLLDKAWLLLSFGFWNSTSLFRLKSSYLVIRRLASLPVQLLENTNVHPRNFKSIFNFIHMHT